MCIVFSLMRILFQYYLTLKPFPPYFNARQCFLYYSFCFRTAPYLYCVDVGEKYEISNPRRLEYL